MPFKGRNQIWTIPNLITLFRLLLIPLMVSLYWKGKTMAALVVFGVSAVSDIADGQIARRCNMVTDLGKMLDPLADKLTREQPSSVWPGPIPSCSSCWGSWP